MKLLEWQKQHLRKLIQKKEEGALRSVSRKNGKSRLTIESFEAWMENMYDDARTKPQDACADRI